MSFRTLMRNLVNKVLFNFLDSRFRGNDITKTETK